MKRLNFVLCLVCTLSISSAAHAATLRTVALTGQQAPGMPDGTVFGGFGQSNNLGSVVLNDAGQTAFSASTIFGGGIWSEGGGSLNLVAAVGQQAPGLPDGVTYTVFHDSSTFASHRLLINDAGVTAFEGYVGGSFGLGFWSIGPGSSALIASWSQPDETPAGLSYMLEGSLHFNHASAAFFSLIGVGPQVGNEVGIWAQRNGNLELVALTGSHAPGTPDGVNFSGLPWLSHQLALNKFGQTAFTGFLTGSGVDATNDGGIWSEGSGSLALVAREGSQAPGMPDGAVFTSVGGPSDGVALNAAGQAAFQGIVKGGGVDSTNDQGIWSESSGSLALVIRRGDHAPGTPGGVNFSSLNSRAQPALNDAGQIAFFAGLTGAGVDSTNNIGLWAGASESLALVARRGEHAPGTEDGVVFSAFPASLLNNNPKQTLMFNAAGQTALVAQLTGSGISTSNDLGIWATDRSGALRLVAREGDPLEVTAGDFRTINSLTFLGDRYTFSTGNADGRPSAFNNLGQLAFHASFTDNTSGIFVSNRVAIPEPSTFALIAVGVLGLVGCAPRRQRHRSDQQNRRTTTTLRARRSNGILRVLRAFVVHFPVRFRETTHSHIA